MRKFKQLWMTLLTVILAVSMIVGGAGISALAVTDSTPIVDTPLTLPASVELGDPIKLGRNTGISVLAPNGADVTTQIQGTGAAAYVEATMVGNYTIRYKAGNPERVYQHMVNVKLDGTFEFRVAHDGAELPTYVNPETEFSLPKAALYKLDEETSEYKVATGDFTYEVYINGNLVDETKKQKLSTPGTYSVQYFCTYKNTSKKFVKEYTIKSQKNFVDKTAPKISVSGIPQTGSLNTKITLPKATATDDYDANPHIKVSVKFDNNGTLEDVMEVELDDYGYAKSATNKAVEFDNVYTLSFYPRANGEYIVEYQAFDDVDVDGEFRNSVKINEVITVSDRTAPKLEKIADEQIPTVWGRSAITRMDTNTSTDQEIVFPMPEYSDNSGEDNIKVSFEIRDTVNNNLVIRFDNIKSEAGSSYTTGNALKGLYDTDAVFDDDGFRFDFSKYKIDSATPLGKYTATYQASDARPNSSSKTYDITLEDTLEDKLAPSVTVDVDDYLFVTDTLEKYTLPTASITDAIDSRPAVKYLLKTTDTLKLEGVDKEAIEVENGAEIEISATEIVYDDVTYDYTGNLKIDVSAKDDVQNEGKPVGDKVITVVSKTSVENKIVLAIDDTALDNNTVYKTGQVAKLGSLKINEVKDDDFRKFSGFELTLRNPDNDIISGVSLETYYLKNGAADGTTVIDDIEFTPSIGGEVGTPEIYTLTVRAFDVSGRSVIVSYPIKVEKSDKTGTEISATPIGTTGSVQTSYKLNNETIRNAVTAADKEYVVRRISNAGKFSLMGIEFTGYSTGAYNFVDGYYTPDFDSSTSKNIFYKHEAYTFTVSDTASPVFEFIGDEPMPTYLEKKSDFVELPEVVAFNDYANAKIEVSIASPSRTLTLGGSHFQKVENGEHTIYKFKPDEDGNYTITYTASVNNSSEVRQTYTIKVGDVIAPAFTLEESHDSTAALNDTFSFKKILFDDVNTDEIKDVTFTKKLIDPSGDTVYTTSAKDTVGAAKEFDSTDEAFTFTMTGNYTVEYTATDKVGNYTIIKETISVAATGRLSPAPLKILRNVLIIVGIALLGGVVIYFVRYYGKGNVKAKKR